MTESKMCDLVTETQRRMDAVVDAAVAWHLSEQEGDGTWFDKAEVLGKAIDSLLKMRNSRPAVPATLRNCPICNGETQAYCAKCYLTATLDDGVFHTALIPAIEAAFHRGVNLAKAAIRAEGSDDWEGSQYKPFFITAIARACAFNIESISPELQGNVTRDRLNQAVAENTANGVAALTGEITDSQIARAQEIRKARQLACPPDCSHNEEEHIAFDLGIADSETNSARNPFIDSRLRFAWESGYSVERAAIFSSKDGKF